MAHTPKGAAAFPTPHYAPGINYDGGMELRDYFAAKAMPAILVQELAHSQNGQYDPQLVADHAYVMADEMLRARGTK